MQLLRGFICHDTGSVCQIKLITAFVRRVPKKRDLILGTVLAKKSDLAASRQRVILRNRLNISRILIAVCLTRKGKRLLLKDKALPELKYARFKNTEISQSTISVIEQLIAFAQVKQSVFPCIQLKLHIDHRPSPHK